QKQCYLNECDFEHYRNLGLGLPPDLDYNHEVTSEPGLYNYVPKPATVLEPERKIRYLSLAEAIAIGIEQGAAPNNPQQIQNAGPTNPIADTLRVLSGGRGQEGLSTIKVLALEPAITAASIESALSKFDPRLTASANWTYTDQPAGNPANAIQALGNNAL